MMLTRCPGCATTFRVTPEQVKARHGKVRCGRCQHVFDAIEFLVEAMAAAPAVSAPAVSEVPESVAEKDLAPAPEIIVPPEPKAPIMEAPPLEEAAPSVSTPRDDILLQPSPLSATYALAKPGRIPSWPWTIAATLVLLALLAQFLIAFRVDLAVKYPAVRPLLEMLCEQAHCIVELPSNPDLIGIETSDLHPARKNGLELTATLRNRAPYAQTWPYLELTLTDGADKPIVRKIITPAQYLPATQTEEDGFAANGGLAVQLLFDAGNLPAAGYRLYVFYP